MLHVTLRIQTMQTLDPITWFEIPAQDLERAMQFYQTVLQWPLKTETMGGMRMAMFPSAADRAGGCLIQEAGYRPSKEGTVVYLTAGPNIDAALQRVPQAGGHVTLGKTALPEGMGYYAQITDTEGNRVGLHALQ